MSSLASIADYVVVGILALALIAIVIGLSLPARGAEEALLALSAAAHARRVMGIVDGAEVASHLTAPARNTCLVDALVAGRPGSLLLLGGRGALVLARARGRVRGSRGLIL